MLGVVAHARQLAATRPVPGVTLGRAELLSRLRAHVEREVPQKAIADEGTLDALLGLLPPKYAYESAMYALLEAQLAGYYEPDGGTMLLAADLDGDAAEATLAHELVHALQDQHYDLKSRMKYEPGRSDALAALQCLAEGDATSAMADVMIGKMAPGKTVLDVPESLFVSQVRAGMDQGPGSDAPRAMRESLIAPYADGLLFVNGLRRKGGWPEVDRAWQRLPVSTEQVLHPEKFAADERPIEVAPTPFASLGAGFAAAESDTYGELALRVTFGEWLSPAAAAEAASHWGGDRASLVTKGDLAALAWRVRYDEAKPVATGYAERAFGVVSAGMVKTLGAPNAKNATFACFEKSGKATLALVRSGRDLLIVAAPAVAADMSPRGDCALAKKWAAEIVR